MIIGITGKAGAGKDTVADLLVREHGFVKVALADPMKRFCKEVLGFTTEQLWGPSEMRNAPDTRLPWPGGFNSHLTPRFALQQLGTEWGRACYEDVWIDYAVRVAQKLSVEGGYTYSAKLGLEHAWRPGDENWFSPVVIPDVRFRNEFEAIRKAGGYVLKITRPGAGLDGAAGAHVSETESAGWKDEDFDAVIENVWTLAELPDVVRATVGRLKVAK